MDEKAITAEPVKKRRRHYFRFSLRTLLVGTALLSILLAYIGSYYHLSRRGIREARAHRMDKGFLYVPYEEAVASENLARHNWLMVFYAPLNEVDADFLNGDEPIKGVIWRFTP